MFTWTVVLKVRRSPNPTVLCIIWTCMHPWVTTCVPVLKTTRFPYSNRRCCHIRVFHPYLVVRSPRLIISWHGPRGGFGHTLATLHGHVGEGWQDSDGPFVPWRDSCLHTFLKYLIYYSFVFISRKAQYFLWAFCADLIHFVPKTFSSNGLDTTILKDNFRFST